MFAHRRKPFAQFMRKHNRHGHQFGGFICGKPKHQPLIPGALIFVEPFTDIDTLRNVR